MADINGYLKHLADASVSRCLWLALGSSVLWFFLWQLAELLEADASGLPESARGFAGWLCLWLSGSVYAALVMFRYAVGSSSLRLAVFLLAGAFSYWMGVQLTLNAFTFDPLWLRVGVVGALAAVFVGAVCTWPGSLTGSVRLFAALAGAGAVGGALIGLSDGDTDAWMIGGHAAWQMLTCLALHVCQGRPASG